MNSNSNSIIWKSEYNISNFKIDKEHQKLFTIAREAMNISKLKDDKEVKNKSPYFAYHFLITSLVSSLG